jgi:RES domain-containing protein
VILHRCFAWDERAAADGPDGPLWFPRIFQGEGRHDNPERYGCLYLSVSALSTVVEQLARFRGQRLLPSLLLRRGLPLALADLELDNDAELVDLDDPVVLRGQRLRPSQIATRERTITQPQALRLHDRHRQAAGLRWWSTYEALWINVTLFDRAASRLRVRSVRALTVADPAVVEAADFFGLRPLA